MPFLVQLRDVLTQSAGEAGCVEGKLLERKLSGSPALPGGRAWEPAGLH